MPKLLWGQSGERLFDAGVDQGVLYFTDLSVVPWPGLISVEEILNDSSMTSIYYDGVKTGDRQTFSDFSATVKALSYPEELLDNLGIQELEPGLFVDGQKPKTFHMAYRSLVGDDLVGLDRGYKIHLLYNLTIVTETITYSTLSNNNAPAEVSFKIQSVPDKAPGYRPTAHVILDSTQLNTSLMNSLESILYGSESTDPYIPSVSDLIQMVLFYQPKVIDPRPITGLSLLVDGFGDLTQTKTLGVYFALPATKLYPHTVPGFYILTETTPATNHLYITDNGDGTWTATDANDAFISMIDGTTFQIVDANASFIDANTYTISDTSN